MECIVYRVRRALEARPGPSRAVHPPGSTRARLGLANPLPGRRDVRAQQPEHRPLERGPAYYRRRVRRAHRRAGSRGAGGAIGPLLAGALVGAFGWRAIFVVVFVFALLLPAAWRIVPRGRGAGARPDLIGAAGLLLGVGGLMWAVTRGRAPAGEGLLR